MNGRRWLRLGASLGTALLVLASFASRGDAQVPACGNWTLTTTTSQSRLGPGAAWDPVNHRVLRFGGFDGANFLNDLWSYTLANGWSQLAPTGPLPSGRDAPGFLYDPVRSWMLLICGNAGSPPNDVWQLSLTGTPTWSQVVTAGTPPTGRFAFSTIYDPIRDRVILFGGYPFTNEVWSLSLAGTPTWSLLTPAGTAPSARYGHAAIYDPVRDRMLMVGGSSSGATPADTWQLSLSGTPTWTQLAPLGAAPPVDLTTGVYDPIRDRMLVLSGHGDQTGSIWSLSLKVQPAWFRIPAGGTAFTARYGHSAVYDPDDDLLLGFNGLLAPNGTAYLTDTNRLDCAGGYWLQTAADHGTVTASPQQACYANGAAVSLTAQGQSGYAFQGWYGDASGTAQPLNVTMDANKVIFAAFPGWPLTVTISPAGSGTVTKSPDQPTYLPGTQVTLTASSSFPFVGWSGDASGNTNPLTVTMDAAKNITANFQAYSLTTIVSPSGSGTVTRNPDQAAFDVGGTKVALAAQPNRGYLFGSWSGDLTGTNNPDTVLMNANKTVTANFVATPVCGGWSLVPTPSTPPPRERVTSVWDPVRHRMLIYGGSWDHGLDTHTVYGDTWGLSFAGAPNWTQVQPGGGPGARSGAIGVYDPIRDRMIIYGGYAEAYGSPALGDVWALTLSGTPTWAQLAAGGPGGRDFASLIYDPVRDRLLLFGGYGNGNDQNDVWQLNLSDTPTWTQIVPSGTPPPPRSRHGAIYDPVRDRMVVFGGNASPASGAWALSLSGSGAWTDLTPTGVPYDPTAVHSIYDPIRDRVLVFYGLGKETISTLDFSNRPNQPFWCQVNSQGPSPSALVDALVYDPDDDLVLSTSLVCHRGEPGECVDGVTVSYRLDLSGGFFLDTSGINGQASATQWCYDSGATATVTANANTGYGFDVWNGDASGTSNPLTLTMDSYKVVQAWFSGRGTGVEDPPVAFGLELRPNPAVGAAHVEYSLPRAAKVRLRVFDIAGREVERLADGMQPPGRHTVVWGQGRGLRAGIYFMRFETPAGTWSKRLVLLR